MKGGFFVSELFEGLRQRVSGRELKIVFPEGLDERIIGAAGRLAAERLVTPILIGNIEQIQAKAQQFGVSLDAAEIYDPKAYLGMDELVTAFVERRKGKATEEEA